MSVTDVHRMKRKPGITFDENSSSSDNDSSNTTTNSERNPPALKIQKALEDCNGDGSVRVVAKVTAVEGELTTKNVKNKKKTMIHDESLGNELGTISNEEEEDEAEENEETELLLDKGNSRNNDKDDKDDDDDDYDDDSNELATMMPRGYKIMRKMGYKPDMKNKPIGPTPIQMITKRNDHQDTLREYNLTRSIDEDEFRQWNSLIHNDKTLSARWHHLQKIVFHMTGDDKVYKPGQDPRDFSVLWRGYVIALNSACEKSRRKDGEGTNSNSGDNKQSSEVKGNGNEGKEKAGEGNLERNDNVVHADPELELFDEMQTSEKIMKLNVFLRSEFHYCCYCGVKYENDQDLYKHCPGLRQEDHE